MFGMHGDMQGSAVALGTLLALTRLKAPFEVHAWLALARNQIGPKAYTQNDVVQACNGVTIEIVHTDAEGRMVLSDTLALATKSKPGLTLDYATLTGACVVALGTRYSGAFTQSAELAKAVIAAGTASGERVWPFPVDADYDEAIDSSIADVKQCIIEGEADHILAARFLSRFVDKDAPWIHVDLAASEHKGGLAHVPTETTGFGVRFTLNLLLDQGLAPS
jgi:leucyl aminopeptidase